MQERAATTRQAVLRAAAESFEARGFAATSINEIVGRSGVTKGALYFHFPSKEALAEAVIAEQVRWREEQEWEPADGLQRLVDVSFRFADALRTQLFVRASVRLTLEYATFATEHPEPYGLWIEEVRRSLERAVEEGVVRPDLDLDRFSRLVAGSVTGLQLLSEATTQRRDVLDLVHTMWEALVPAMVVPEHRHAVRYGVERAGRS